MKIYLSGGLGSNWQDEILPLLQGHQVLDPRGMLDMPEFAKRELEEVVISDCLIGYFEKDNPSGQGLCAEIAVARFHPGKQRLVILCSEKDCFVNGIVDHLFDNFLEMKLYIKNNFKSENIINSTSNES